MDITHLLDSLNLAQREAVSAPLGHYLILAGAGSGKTRVLVHRIGWLLAMERVSPHAVLAVTFTNKAAGEMRARCAQLIERDTRGLWVGTFHGIAHRLLRQHWREAKLPETFQILDSDDQLRLIKRTIQGLNLDEARWPPRQAAWYINNAKDEGKRPDAIEPGGNANVRTLLDIYRAYEAACQRSGLVDFAELLLRSHELWLQDEHLLSHYRERFQHLLVDEFQDTNSIQYAWVRMLAGATAKVFIVGDDDQAIYGWRGAKVENVQHFLRDFPSAKTIRLEQNYRSTGTILQAANAIIANNPNRLGKKLWTDSDPGVPLQLYAAYNEQDEARYVVEQIGEYIKRGAKPSECAILYRSNAQSRLFEEQFIQRDIAYRVYGGLRFFDRAEVKDALAYLRLIANPNDDAAFERVVNTPARSIGERTLDGLRVRARREGLTLWRAALVELAATTTKSEGMAGRAKNALRAFLTLVEELSKSTEGLTLAEQMEQVIVRSGLRDFYEKDSRGSAESRIENLDELINVASRFELTPEDAAAGLSELAAFLSHAALEAGETQGESWEDCVQLMTLHSAKGLEFSQVFLVGLEDGLFPSQKSIGEEGRLEEERRLAYVGITRARDQLTLCYAESRRLHGQESYNRPSRFLTELPRELIYEVRSKVQVARPVYNGRFNIDEVPALRLGQHVAHDSFGEGVVVDCEGNGAHTRVQVNFTDSGSKWLVLAYANLTVL